jgi:hypothetical protein
MDAPGGFEPPLTDSESVVLPLHHGAMVEVEGIEPPIFWFKARHVTITLHLNGGAYGNRTRTFTLTG